jgi:hypothetical protein
MFLRIHWRNYRDSNDATRSFLLSRTGLLPDIDSMIEPVQKE